MLCDCKDIGGLLDVTFLWIHPIYQNLYRTQWPRVGNNIDSRDFHFISSFIFIHLNLRIYNIQDKNNKVKVVQSSRFAGIKTVPLCSGVFETGFKLFEIFWDHGWEFSVNKWTGSRNVMWQITGLFTFTWPCPFNKWFLNFKIVRDI